MIYTNPSKYGDLKKFTVKVDGKDVSDAVTAAAVFQDLFTPTWSAQVFFNDTANLILTLPIHPGSKISIEIETELAGPGDGNKTFEMIVHRIGDKVFENHLQQTYTCFCSSKAFLLNQTKRIQKVYTNQKQSEIVNQVVGEFLGGSVESDDSDQTVDVMAMNWSPFTTIAWLAKTATKKNAADYVFFQRDNDKYIFKSMETLYNDNSEATGVTFIQRPAEIRGADNEYDTDYSVAVSDFQVEHSDAISNMASGYFKNKLVSYNILGKTWSTTVFSFGDDCADDLTNKAWDNPLFDEAEDSNIVHHPTHPGMSQNSTVVDTATTWNGSRRSAIQKLDQEKIIIQIPYSVGANEWIGKSCKFELPTHEDMSGDALDKYRSGKYLIIALAHMISKDGATLNIEMVKKRLEQKLEDSN